MRPSCRSLPPPSAPPSRSRRPRRLQWWSWSRHPRCPCQRPQLWNGRRRGRGTRGGGLRRVRWTRRPRHGTHEALRPSLHSTLAHLCQFPSRLREQRRRWGPGAAGVRCDRKREAGAAELDPWCSTVHAAAAAAPWSPALTHTPGPRLQPCTARSRAIRATAFIMLGSKVCKSGRVQGEVEGANIGGQWAAAGLHPPTPGRTYIAERKMTQRCEWKGARNGGRQAIPPPLNLAALAPPLGALHAGAAPWGCHIARKQLEAQGAMQELDSRRFRAAKRALGCGWGGGKVWGMRGDVWAHRHGAACGRFHWSAQRSSNLSSAFQSLSPQSVHPQEGRK